MYSPFVYWGQDAKNISLRVELKGVQAPTIDLNKRGIRFMAYGTGMMGANDYIFQLDFFEPILNLKSIFKVNERQIDFLIKKECPKIWPRLTESTIRRHWLRVDFDKFHNEDENSDEDRAKDEDDDQLAQDDEMEGNDDKMNNQAKRRRRRSKADEWNQLRDQELDFFRRNGIGGIGRDLFMNSRRKVRTHLDEAKSWAVRIRQLYLFLYNLIQFLGYSIILGVFVVKYWKQGPEAFFGIYKNLGGLFKFLTLLKGLDVWHRVLKFHSGDVWTALFQFVYRLFVIIVLIDSDTKLNERPVVFFLILLYSLMDYISSLFYALQVYGIKIGTITWLRCTLWVPCYPLAFLFEGILFLRNIPYHDLTNRFSLQMPNRFNFSFSMAFLLKFYLFVCFIPVMYVSMNRLYKHRIKLMK